MLTSYFQLFSFIALVWAVSYIAQVKITKLAYQLNGRLLYLFMVSVGVMVHETSHAIVAIIFGHKINRISFFKPDLKSTTLGFVEHSYNPLSLYQRIGSFFIGFAPLYLAPLSLYLISYLLLPQFEYFYQIIEHIGSLTVPELPESVNVIKSYFIKSYQLAPAHTLIWLFIGCSIALSCGPSPADVKNSIVGLIPVAIILYFMTTYLEVNFPTIIVGGAYLLIGLCLIQIVVLTSFLMVIRFIKTTFVKATRRS